MNRQRQSLSTENSRASSGGGIPERFRRGSAEREERRLAKMLAGAHRARGGIGAWLSAARIETSSGSHIGSQLSVRRRPRRRGIVWPRGSAFRSRCVLARSWLQPRAHRSRSAQRRCTPEPRDLCAEARDPIASTHADAAELERRSWRREAIDRRRRGPEPCRPNGRDHSAVVPAARVAEEVDRDAEEPPQLLSGARNLASQLAGADGGEIRMGAAVRIDLPSSCDQPAPVVR